MTLPAPPEDEAAQPESDATASDSALRRYGSRLRRQRLIYFSVVGVIVVAAVVLATVAWTQGEVGHTTSNTADTVPASLPPADPAASPQRAWTTAAQTAIGNPQWGGTVVVHDRHTVRGVDARTGRTTWSYERSDRTVCTAAQLDGTTVAVFSLRGNCDQVTGLDSGTGARRWTRTLDIDALPVNGTPTFSTGALGSLPTLLVRTSTVIYALDPSNGYNRWTFSHYGCEISGVRLGSAGALISQNCSTSVRCEQALPKNCGAGRQLLLRDPYQSRDEGDQKKSKDNPDRVTWKVVGASPVPVSADTIVTALDATGALVRYNADTGKVDGTTTLSPAPSSPQQVVVDPVARTELVWIDGYTYAVSGDDPAKPIWTAPSATPPTVVGPDEQQDPSAAAARVTVTTDSGATTLDPTTGEARSTTALTPAPPSGSRSYPLGAGFLVASSDATTAYA